jgi:hypothetical protein
MNSCKTTYNIWHQVDLSCPYHCRPQSNSTFEQNPILPVQCSCNLKEKDVSDTYGDNLEHKIRIFAEKYDI